MFSAYNIKKVLPKLIIAAIGIQVSWWVTIALVTINNSIAHGIEGLMYAPFGGVSQLTLSGIFGNPNLHAGAMSGTAVFSSVAAGVAFGAAGASSLVGILALAATAALGAIIALFTLILRKALLVTLILVAPLAIAAWVLPGTEKLWKIWWESFSKLLLMYPLILMMIAGGRIFAYIASNLPINQFAQFAMIILGFFGPLLLIPATLKLSGAAFASLTGAINSRGKGAFDRLRNVRSQEAQKTWAKTKSYQRFGDRNAVARGMSTAFGAIGNPRDAMRGRAGIRSGRRVGLAALGAETFKNDQTIATNSQDDGFLLALFNEDLARRKITAAEEKFRKARLAGDQAGMLSARAEVEGRTASLENALRVPSRKSASTRIQAGMALARTGYQFAPGDEGYQQFSSTMESLYGNDKAGYRLAMNEGQYYLKGAGRTDMGGINYGAGLDVKSSTRKLSNTSRGQGKTDQYYGMAGAWMGNSVLGEGGKTLGSDAMSDLMLREAKDGTLDLDSVAEYHSMLQGDYLYATDANKLEIQKQLDAIHGLATGLSNTEERAIPVGARDSTVGFLERIQQQQQRGAATARDITELPGLGPPEA